MLINNGNEDDYVTEVKSNICDFHKRQPWETAWAGCTCSAGFSRRLATPEERAANIKAREDEQCRREKHMRDYDAGKIK